MHMSDMEQYGSGQAIDVSALRAAVRGERPLEGLAAARNGRAALSVCAADLAEGIVNLQNDPAALSEWASFILAVSESFVLEDQLSDRCDRLLSCIWDLAFGAHRRDPAIALARAVRGRPRLA
jgi:hypothetical protein